MGKRVISFDMGSRSIGFAYVEWPNTLIDWGILDLGTTEAHSATRALVDALENELWWIRDSDAPLVIEQQPRSGLPKVLAHCIECYAHTVDSRRIDSGRIDSNRRRRTVKFMSAKQKFLCADALQYGVEVAASSQSSASYRERKRAATHIVECGLLARLHATGDRDDEVLASYYWAHAHKQRSDLADAYLQACRALELMNN